MAFIAPTAGRVNIAIALAPFLFIHRRQVTIAPTSRCQVAVAPPIAVAPRRPSQSIRHRAIHCHPSPLYSQPITAALAPSLAVKEPSCAVHCHRGAVAPSLTVGEPSRRPSPSRSRCAIHCRRGAVGLYLTIKEPSAMLTDNSGHSSRPSKPLVIRLVVVLPLLTPPPPICQRDYNLVAVFIVEC